MDDPEAGWVDFAAFVSARLPALLAYGYVLSGNQDDAQDLVQEALARAGARWRHICRKQAAEGHVRTTMARLQMGLLQVRLTSVTRDGVPREGCRDAEEVPPGVQAGRGQGRSSR